MKMRNLSNLLLGSILIFSLGCTDLEEDIQGDFTEDFDPDNSGVGQSDNVNGSVPADGINAAFSPLLQSSANHNNYFSIQEVSTDEVVITQKGGDWFDGGIWLRMHRHEWTSTHPAFNNAWNNSYEGITEANRLIDAITDVAALAQLRTVRAYYYWRLMDLFGGVKIVTESEDDPDQASRTEVFNFIEAELKAAIPDLGTGRPDYGRVSQGGAYALLTRLYLNAEVYTGTAKWQEAIDAADEVINSGMYSLSPSYADVFAPDNVDNAEHIWVVPFDEATGAGMNLAQMTLHYPSQLTYDLAEQPWNGYSTLEEFYNSYADGDSRKANNFLVGPQTDLNENPILDVAFDPADEDGAPVNYTPAINELEPSGSRQAGARLGKFSFKIGQQNEMDNDYPLFRYGGVLLDKAEAVARRDGNWASSESLMLVNQLRSRASASTLTTIDEDVFLAERGRELFIESLRRNDLIRFGKWGAKWWEKSAHSNANLNLMPIPQEQIDAANGTLNQNPGY